METDFSKHNCRSCLIQDTPGGTNPEACLTTQGLNIMFFASQGRLSTSATVLAIAAS